MKKITAVTFLILFATPVMAMPIAPVQAGHTQIVQIRKGGGTSRSAVSGKFVSGSYAKSHKSTTVTHRKY